MMAIKKIKSRKIKPLFILTLIITLTFLSFFSCKQKNRETIVENKYREKNLIELLSIESINGNIELNGWAKDDVEINTRKILLSGLNTDLNQMEIEFEKGDKSLKIKTKIPAMINGKIDLKIYVPYNLLKTYIIAANGEIKIDQYLGDLDINQITGNINAVFQGNILRINSQTSRINLAVDTALSADMIINDDNGNIMINLDAVGINSFLDLKSLNSIINLYIAPTISHNLFLLTKGEKYNITYDMVKTTVIEGSYTYLKAYRGNDSSNLSIKIIDTDGKISLQRLNK